VTVRPAREGDVGLLLGLIGELAEYERLADEALGTEELLREHLFGARPAAEAAIAEHADTGPVGFVLWYTTFSTFQCLPGIWVEDLFVRPERRGGGVGRALLAHVAGVAVERGCGRLELAALDWNEPALGFYRALGARSLDEWKTQRFEAEALERLATPA
jgi:GNAT superfamily N-acetyltransferase